MIGKFGIKSVIAAAAAAGLSLAIAAPASAADYPDRPITMIVPLAPGGSTDVIGRIMAQAMGAKLGQTVVVENVSGAAGVVGVTRAERSEPDGYTIQWGMWGTNMANGAIYSLDFDMLNDFEPIVLVATQPFFIDSRKSLPANNLKELIAWLKTNGDKTTEGNSGVGSPSHIAGILLQQTLGLKWQMVPYRSAGLSMQDLAAGTVDIALDAPAVVMPQLQGGNIKTYAVAAKQRLAILPDIPTTDEAGLPGFYFSFWHAIWAPKGTPKPIIAKLNAAAVAALADPETRKRLIDLGQEIYPPAEQTPQALYAFQKAEIEKWYPIIKAAGVKAQ
ncbi:MAG: tripartite tricarboxylate transporter substrate-binding protein [Xanthobacteraceae bacterium]|jgi:tripartite-type tricarboxylate transporter receptor subunit TctC